MAYDFLLGVVENGLTATKNSNSFDNGMGTVIDLRIDVKAISGAGASVQVIVQESDDNVTFSDSAMTKVYNAVKLNEKFVFLKQKPYHRFRFVVAGTTPNVSIEVNQG
ncbi:putative trehalose synthase [Bacillus tianshenii]|uniref:Trehalose synthase n=1 Tax=Sutcliffiella tianshenii TaxID=1463404 RepID=A0ABS2NZQ7_9BACI|nr:hypothetical protein [Bacillus tianshenii]MBM7620189.1 putative trehalose synthase [Bacillus tianshenii]